MPNQHEQNSNDKLKQERERFKAMDYYARLGVSRDANEKQIRKAFQKMSTKYHPDKPGGDTVIMQYLGEAYNALTKAKGARKEHSTSYSRSKSAGSTYSREEERNRAEEEKRRREEQEQRARKEREDKERAERLKREVEEKMRQQKIIEAAEEARKGSYEYMHFVKSLAPTDTQNFITKPEVLAAIKQNAINKAVHGVSLYNRFIQGWVKEGNLKREIIDLDPDLIREIKKIAEEKKKVSESFYQEYVKGWQNIGINI